MAGRAPSKPEAYLSPADYLFTRSHEAAKNEGPLFMRPFLNSALTGSGAQSVVTDPEFEQKPTKETKGIDGGGEPWLGLTKLD